MKTLFLSPLQPQNAGGGGGGGGGVGGVSRLRFPPGPHLRSSRFSRHPRLRQAPTRRFAKNRNLRWFLWGKGPLVGRAPRELYSSMRRGSVFAPAFQPLGQAQASGPRQPSRVKNSKNAPVLIGSLVAPIDFLHTVPAA